MFRNVAIVAVGGVLALPPGANGSDPYDLLLNNPRVTNAIESNPFIEPGTYRDFLLMKIDQLETEQTESWDDYRHPSPHTDQEIAEVILQKVALSLYIDVNELVPWRLLDYDDENLHIVLGDAYSELMSASYLERDVFVNLNPLLPFAYANDLRTLYPDRPIGTPKDLLDLTIIKMRDDRWVHQGAGLPWAVACRDIGYLGFPDFECLQLIKKGTSALTPRFIYSVLHAQNVPSRMILWFGHGGIEFPSLGLTMNGDGVYNSLESGIRISPNFLPVDLSFLELPLYEKWMAMERCQGWSRLVNHETLAYLSLYDDPAWNVDVLKSFCWRTLYSYPVPGDFLRETLVYSTVPESCQNEDPNAENYQAPPLTDEEFDEWFAAIAEFATDCSSCLVDADCDDGDWCNGTEYCDQYGFCDVGYAPACDDGLVCTYDRCIDSACVFPPARYGDVNADEVVDLTDILCMLDGFTGQFDTCGLESLDIGNCTPDGKIDLADILAVLDGFQGLDPCCGN